MPSIKLSVTVRSALQAKYPPAALARIDAAIAKWIAADAARGIATTHVALDDAAQMARLGVAPVKGQATAIRCKRALDALCRKLAPEYVVLLGGGEIVPYFQVANPSHDPDGDTDTEVLTDNPYACSTAYRAKERKSYLVPDRVLGRITDLDGDPDASWIVDQLARSAAWKPKPRDHYASAYAVVCDTWKGGGEHCMRHLGLAVADLMISPPEGDASAKARGRLSRPLHVIKCHGAELEAAYFGEKAGSFPEILTSATLKSRMKPDTLVAAMCCYGAQIYSPQDPACRPPGALPIAATYLAQGAVGMMGATKIAWVGDLAMLCADWIVAGYLKAAMTGASIGRAMLESKQDYMRHLTTQGQAPDEADEKTLIEFVLLGDPSIHPVVAAAVPAKAGPRAKRASRPSPGVLAERKLRRVVRAELATQIRRVLPRREAAPAPSAALARKVFALAAGLLSKTDAGFGLVPSRARASKLVTEGTVAAGAASSRRGLRAAAAPKTARSATTEFSWTARQLVKGRPHIRLLKAEVDAQGTVLRSRLLHSA